MNVLCIGESLLEITCPINVSVSEGQKLKLDEKIENGGGHAGNIAYLFGKWGVETYIASMMGADDAANKIKKEYENIGVKTDSLETAYDRQTAIKLILNNQTNKNNTIYEIANNAYMKKYAYIGEPDLIISDGSDLNATIAAFDRFPKAKSFLMATNNSNEILELCRYVNYIIFNQKAAELISSIKFNFEDSSTLVNAYNKLKQKFSKAEILITIGERGSIYSINGQIKIMPPVKTNVIDTNGAGDTFVGAFAYGMGRDFGLEKSIAYATIAASISTTKISSRMSIPSLTEVSGYYDSKFGAQNNPNNDVNNKTEVENVVANMNAGTNTGINSNASNLEVKSENVNEQNA